MRAYSIIAKKSKARTFMLFESICYQNQFQNLAQHTARMQRARKLLFGLDDKWDAAEILEKYASDNMRLRQILLPDTLYKVRIDYNESEYTITWKPYKKRSIKSLQIMDLADFDYSHKYANRTHLEQLLAASAADDVLICTDNVVRDTSYSNVVFAEGGKSKKLYTPAMPLLQGTQRAALLAAGEIEEAHLLKSDLQRFKYVHLINAMLPLGACKVPVSSIK
jgi:4-amino-4-deoxychorismate lyase